MNLQKSLARKQKNQIGRNGKAKLIYYHYSADTKMLIIDVLNPNRDQQYNLNGFNLDLFPTEVYKRNSRNEDWKLYSSSLERH